MGIAASTDTTTTGSSNAPPVHVVCPKCPESNCTQNNNDPPYSELLIYYVTKTMTHLPAQQLKDKTIEIKNMSEYSQKKIVWDILDDYIGREGKMVLADQKTRDLYAMNMLAHR